MPGRAALAVFFILALGAAAYAGPPEIKRECSLCHVTHSMQGGFGLKEPLPALCLGCHPDRNGAGEHRIDVPLSAGQEAPGPLLEGMVSCTTCHDPHGGEYVKMLRAPAKTLCAGCHGY